MKQIGARQEAGRIGGIGPCGRELCCSGWMTNFNTVSTSAARIQDISLNPQKLAGQCGKLKCCMNFEVDTYIDASKGFPSKEIPLETADNTYYHFKTDVFKRQISYSTSQNFAANIVTISPERAKDVIAMNKKGQKAEKLEDLKDEAAKPVTIEYESGVGQDSLTRFDVKKRPNNNSNGNKNRRQDNRPQQARPDQKDNKRNNAPKFQKPIRKGENGSESNEK